MKIINCALICLVLLFGGLLVLGAGDKNGSTANGNKELPSAEIIVDERFELDDETLENVMRDFGRHIKDLVTDEMENMVEDVKNKSPAQSSASEEIKQFKNVNKILSKDTQERIEMAGKKNEGELTQSGINGDENAHKSLLEQVGGKLQSAGTFIGHQMAYLSGLAPKLRGRVEKIPAQLRKIMHWPNFLKYKIRFNKVYRSLREELYRQMIYLRTQAIVGIQNVKYLCGQVSHLMKATQFADWTDKEYSDVYHNNMAETAETATDIEVISPETKLHLLKLAEAGKTIFGRPAPAAGPNVPAPSEDDIDLATNSLRRRKREDKPYNELEDDEEEEEYSNASSGAPSYPQEAGKEEELSNDLDNGDVSKVVENFAAQFDKDADTSNIDGLNDILDEALSEKPDFEPIDLRKTTCVPEPENQDVCGACYAYATTYAASYFNCINSEDRKVERYNARFTSDCGRYITPESEGRPKVNGCHGGRVSHAIKFVDQVGVYEFMDYEFARRGHSFAEDTCAYPRPNVLEHWIPMQKIPPTPVSAYHNVHYGSLTWDVVDLHLRTVGPVFVNIRVWDGFKNYATGIVDTFKEAPKVDIHSMLIVGHDKDPNGKDYYIILNSHGTSWGEEGFARVYADTLQFFMMYLGGLLPNTGVDTDTRRQ